MLPSQESTWQKFKPFVFILIAFIAYGIFNYYRNNKVGADGVYTVCTVLNTKPSRSGPSVSIKYKFRGIEYKKSVGENIGNSYIGSKFFLKVLPDDPGEFIFLENNPVPDCLLNVTVPDNGWKEMPSCQ